MRRIVASPRGIALVPGGAIAAKSNAVAVAGSEPNATVSDTFPPAEASARRTGVDAGDVDGTRTTTGTIAPPSERRAFASVPRAEERKRAGFCARAVSDT